MKIGPAYRLNRNTGLPSAAKLGILSFLLLFLELLLIRLIGTEVRIFAYLSNLVLLAVFLGSGIGMFYARRTSLMVSTLMLTILTSAILLGMFSAITDYVTPLSSSAVWYAPTAVPFIRTALGVGEIVILFAFIILLFVPIGQHIGRYFSGTKHTVFLYTVNLICSVLGILSFYLLSSFRISPYIGIVISEGILFLLSSGKNRVIAALCVAVTFFAVLVTFPANLTVWSPYQKLSVVQEPYDEIIGMQNTILVNNVGYMSLLDLSAKNADRMRRALFASGNIPAADLPFENLYDLPYRIRPGARDVLILGAGGGNDAAAALRAGASDIDAVEIDPAIVDLGNRFHPEHPLTDPRVRVTVDDGRAFVRRTDKKYDIVIMGFTDSHTTNSTLTNIQLDNYLYTEESFREIKHILKPGGLFFISIDVIQPWIGSHIRSALERAFGSPPISAYLDSRMTGGGTVFLASANQQELSKTLSGIPGLSEYLQKQKRTYPLADTLTDDWPYLYLRGHRIPVLHLVVSGLLVIMVLAAGAKIGLTSGFMPVPFFLGAAFLLYEFQNVAKTSLLYGNTWVTNAYTITGVLVFSLLSNLAFVSFRLSDTYVYLLLFLSILAEILVPTAVFTVLPYVSRIVLATLFLNLPVFFSGWIFISLLSRAKNKQAVLASNFLGSFAGGILSFLSYITGIRALLFVVGAAYVASYVFSGKKSKG